MNSAFLATALVVDDDPWICHFLGRFLERKGYQVKTTLSGHEALEIADQLHPQILLIDMAMPVMDGLETLERLRQHGERGAAIFITGRESVRGNSRARALGVHSVLKKPFNLRDLKNALQNGLECWVRANPALVISG